MSVETILQEKKTGAGEGSGYADAGGQPGGKGKEAAVEQPTGKREDAAAGGQSTGKGGEAAAKQPAGKGKEAAAESLPGGKYQILGSGGKGGAGEVFQVYDLRLGKRWAAKRVSKNSPGMEALVLGKLDGGCFPRIVDVVEEGSSRCLIMDWIEGETLQERMKREGPMTNEEARRTGIALCDAIGALHRMQPPLLYLDCKPSNIMVDQNKKLWLIDFGSALEGAEPEVKPFSGSFGYAAPEQFGLYRSQKTHTSGNRRKRGRCGSQPKRYEGRERKADVRSDVYGLGRTLYALLGGADVGKPPYGACPLRDCNPEVSPGLAEIVEKCTKERPEERFQTMEAVKNALEETAEEKRRDRLKKWGARCGLWLLLGAALLCAGCFYRALQGTEVLTEFFSLAGTAGFAELSHLWQRFVLEREYYSVGRLEPEPLQSVMRTEKRAGRWLLLLLLCSGLLVLVWGKTPTKTVLAQEIVFDHEKEDREKIDCPGGAGREKEDAVRMPLVLRDAKMRKLLVKEGCALRSREPVFLELDPAFFEEGERLEIRVTAEGEDGAVQEYRFWYVPVGEQEQELDTGDEKQSF